MISRNKRDGGRQEETLRQTEAEAEEKQHGVIGDRSMKAVTVFHATSVPTTSFVRE